MGMKMRLKLIAWLAGGAVLRPRWVAAGMYIFFLISGTLFILFPPLQGLEELIGEANIYLWHIFLLLGSTVSLIGCLLTKRFHRHFIEASGLVLLITTMIAYAVISLRMQTITGEGWGNASMLGAIAFGLLGRFIEMIRLGFVLEDIEKREEDG